MLKNLILLVQIALSYTFFIERGKLFVQIPVKHFLVDTNGIF